MKYLMSWKVFFLAVVWLVVQPCFAATVTPMVASGLHHILALKSDGTVAGWGYNIIGQATVPAGLSGVTAVASGLAHNLVLKLDGTIEAWGSNLYGVSTIPAGLNGVVAIAAGRYHSVALKGDGTVVAWGLDFSGQATVPVALNSVVAIAAGYEHTLALKSDGTVVAWGGGSLGQSGVPIGLSGVVAIAGGGQHIVALKSDTTVVAWGDNRLGQTTVPVGLSGVTAVAAGGSHTLALKSDGTVVAWGDNLHGQLTVPAGLNGVVGIAAGYAHSVALKSDGTVVVWGYNLYGQRALPAGLNLNVPVTIVDNIPPVLTLNGLAVLSLAQGAAFVDAGAVVSDNYSTGLIATVTGSVNTASAGTYILTYAASDAAGNAAAVVRRTVYVRDVTPPAISVNGSNPYTLEAGQTYIDALATVTDNVDARNTSLAGVSTVNTNVIGSYSVTYNAIDAAANTARQVVRIVDVVDTTPPRLSLNNQSLNQYEANGLQNSLTLPAPIATDLFAVTLSNDAPAFYPLNSLVEVVWTATDANGNVTIFPAEGIIFRDTTAPVMVGVPLADVVFEATGAQSSVSLVSPVATDIFAVTLNNNAPTTFPLGTTVVIWTATDANGLTTSSAQNVVLSDTTAPVLALIGAADIYVEAASLYVDLGAVSTDAVDGLAAVAAVGAVNLTTVGLHTLSYHASDAAGNAALPVVRRLHVQDTTAPTIVGLPLADIVFEATGRQNRVSLTPPLSTDLFAVLLSHDAPSFYPLGTTVVTWLATDANGNTTTATQNVVVRDTIAPASPILQPSLQMQSSFTTSPNLLGVAEPSATVNVYDFTVLVGTTTADLYGGWSYTSTLNLGQHSLSFTAIDASGNRSVPSKLWDVAMLREATEAVPEKIEIKSANGGGCLVPSAGNRLPWALLPCFILLFIGLFVGSRQRMKA